MKRSSACIAVGLLVAGCAGQAERPPVTEVTRIPEQGDWFCQLSQSGEGWTCVRDAELAEDPVPERLPQPAAPLPSATERFPDREPEAPPADAGDVPSSEPAAPSPQQVYVPGSAADAQATGPAPAAAPAEALPEYVRLAYRPAEPTPLAQLPREFYAVQVLATNTRQALEAFVERHGIAGVSAARVERDGELYYVLLLGVYESLDIARRAVAELPRPFQDHTPWIRPLGSLQSAMARADALGASAGL
jgi:septal ring-binding cell division protein DamX